MSARKHAIFGRTFQYAEVLGKVREAVLDLENPNVTFGTLAKIGTLEKGTRAQIVNLGHQHKNRIMHHVKKRWPLDMWRVYAVPMVDQWKGVEIYVELVGIAKDAAAKRAWTNQLQARLMGKTAIEAYAERVRQGL